ncbi:MAG: bactofilin family protein [Pseudomonadota bacterium]
MSMFDKRKDNETPAAPEPPPPSAASENRPRSPSPEPASRGIAIIGKTIRIQGDITGEESLVVEGQVDGTIHLKNNDLTVGQSGQVNANLAANVVRIDGEVKGDILGQEKVIVTKTGRVQGNIVGPRVTLEDGAKFKGSIDMDPAGAERGGSPQTPKSVPSGKSDAASGKPAAVEETKTSEASGTSGKG